MKKIYPLLICFFILHFSLYAQYKEDVFWVGGEIPRTASADIEWNRSRLTDDRDIVWAEEAALVEEIMIGKTIVGETITEEEPLPEEGKIKGPFYVKNRTFEMGLLNTSFGFANDFISAMDILQKKMVIDLDELKNGLKLQTNLFISPVYFQLNFKDKWGFGLSTGLDATGILGLSGGLLSMGQADNEKSDAAGAVFVSASPNAFFSIKKFKVKVKPAMYYPLVYIKPDISYTNRTTTTNLGGQTILKLEYDLQVYTAFSLEDDFSISNLINFDFLTASPGFDVSLGLEFPLSEALGLTEISKLLDFDVGLDVINIPVMPSSMMNYMKISGIIGKDDPLDFFDDGAFDNFVTTDETTYGEKKISVLRPFKLLAWAVWRPFEKQTFTFIPSIGFALNPLYVQPFSLEGGITAKIDLRNLFIIMLGVNYNDCLWKNSLGFALNFRFFELDLGVDIRSPNILKSFTGAGVGVNFGLKFGY